MFPRYDHMNINYVKGDATQPQGEGKKIIVHICNDIGKFGAGFSGAISNRWIEPEAVYRAEKNYSLGNVQFVQVSEDITVANMIAQRGVRTPENMTPINYAAVRACLNEVNKLAYTSGATIHMPRIGCGLAGGSWDKIEEIIHDVASVDVYVYDLK